MAHALLYFCFWIHMKEAVFAKHMSHFLLNTQYLSSKAHPYGSDNVFPLELLYFFSPHPNLSECGSWNLRSRGRKKGREKEKGCKWRRSWFACQHLYPDTEAGRQRGLGVRGAFLVQLFKDCWLASSLVGPGAWEQAAHIPPSDCSWWNTHVPLCLPSTWHMQTPQIQAAAMCCGQLRHAKPGQGLDQTQTNPERVQF